MKNELWKRVRSAAAGNRSRRGAMLNAVIFVVVLAAVILAGVFLIRDRLFAWGLFGTVLILGLLFFSDVPHIVRRQFGRARKRKERARKLRLKEAGKVARKVNSLRPSRYATLEAFLEAGRSVVPRHLADEEAVKEALTGLSRRWNR